MKITYKQLRDLGFERIETTDLVAFKQTGQHPIVVCKDLFTGVNQSLEQVKVHANWMQEKKGIVEVYACNRDSDILSKLEFRDLESLKAFMGFFKKLEGVSNA